MPVAEAALERSDRTSSDPLTSPHMLGHRFSSLTPICRVCTLHNVRTLTDNIDLRRIGLKRFEHYRAASIWVTVRVERGRVVVPG